MGIKSTIVNVIAHSLSAAAPRQPLLLVIMDCLESILKRFFRELNCMTLPLFVLFSLLFQVYVFVCIHGFFICHRSNIFEQN